MRLSSWKSQAAEHADRTKLQKKDQRQAITERRMPCFVVKQVHASDRTGRTAENSNEKKRSLGDPPFSKPGFPFVDPHGTETDEAEKNAPSDKKSHHKNPFFSKGNT